MKEKTFAGNSRICKVSYSLHKCLEVKIMQGREEEKKGENKSLRYFKRRERRHTHQRKCYFRFMCHGRSKSAPDSASVQIAKFTYVSTPMVLQFLSNSVKRRSSRLQSGNDRRRTRQRTGWDQPKQDKTRNRRKMKYKKEIKSGIMIKARGTGKIKDARHGRNQDQEQDQNQDQTGKTKNTIQQNDETRQTRQDKTRYEMTNTTQKTRKKTMQTTRQDKTRPDQTRQASVTRLRTRMRLESWTRKTTRKKERDNTTTFRFEENNVKIMSEKIIH